MDISTARIASCDDTTAAVYTRAGNAVAWLACVMLREGIEAMEDKIQAFRPPLVTATGIILGFLLNFAATWVKTESPLGDGLAYFVGICVLVGAGCLIATCPGNMVRRLTSCASQ